MINIYLAVALAGVLIASFSQILLKRGAMRPHESFIKDYLNVPVIAGYGMMFISVLFNMIAFKGLAMMTIPVIEALGFVIVPFLSYLFFGEKLTKSKLVGIAVIVAGIVIYNL